MPSVTNARRFAFAKAYPDSQVELKRNAPGGRSASSTPGHLKLLHP
jgi:hypothetical protein